MKAVETPAPAVVVVVAVRPCSISWQRSVASRLLALGHEMAGRTRRLSSTYSGRSRRERPRGKNCRLRFLLAFRNFDPSSSLRWDGHALRSTKEIYETDFRVETFKSHAATLKYLGGGGHLARQQKAAEERLERVYIVRARTSKITLTLTPQSRAAAAAKPDRRDAPLLVHLHSYSPTHRPRAPSELRLKALNALPS